MEFPASSTNIEAGTKNAEPTFFVVCEDWATGFRAKYFIDDICHRLGSGTTINRNYWRLSLLRTERLRERAAAEAGEANAIVLALDKRTGIPDDVQKWVVRVLDGGQRPGLIGMVQEELIENDPPDVLVDYMHKVAAQAGAVFFCWNELNECSLEKVISNLENLKS